jgi:hypothetical protein
MIYSICTLNGKTISTSHGDYADDNAAIEKARCYLRSSAADTIRVHRDAPFYPLGDMIAELKALPPDPENMNDDRAEWAVAALRHFQCTTGSDYDDTLSEETAEPNGFALQIYGSGGFEALELPALTARSPMTFDHKTPLGYARAAGFLGSSVSYLL